MVSDETARIEKVKAELAQKWGWVLALGGLLLLSGLAAISAPHFASLAMVVVLGWVVLLGGISQLVSAVYLRGAQRVGPLVISGLLTLACGLVLLIYPVAGIAMMTLLLGCFLLAEAIFKGVGAFDIKPHPAWTWMLADGIVTGVLSILILGGWPDQSFAVIGLLVGISLAITGVSLVSAAFYLRRP